MNAELVLSGQEDEAPWPYVPFRGLKSRPHCSLLVASSVLANHMFQVHTRSHFIWTRERWITLTYAVGREKKLNPPFSLGKQTGTKSKTLKYKAKNMSKHFYCSGIIKSFLSMAGNLGYLPTLETKQNSTTKKLAWLKQHMKSNVKMGRRIVEAGHGWHVTCNFRRHATHVQL